MANKLENIFWIIVSYKWTILKILLVCLIIAVIISVVPPTVYETSKHVYETLKRWNIIWGLAIGLALGLIIAFLGALFNKTYPSIEDLRKNLNSLPMPVAFLGAIPKIERTESVRVSFVTHDAPKCGPSEVFRIIRTKLLFTDNDEPRIMLVASSTQSEGRTTITSNLAISFAQMDKRVLILDADMRRPSLHKIFPAENVDTEGDGSRKIIDDRRKPGLSELLIMMNEKPPKEALGKIVRETGIEKLSFIPSGTIPPNPSELLSSENMRKLISLLKEEYDYVFIDSPPVRAISDPIILASMVDYIVYVLDVVHTRKCDIKYGLEILQELNPRATTGVVCNLLER